MAHNPHRHSPGPTSIEPKKPGRQSRGRRDGDHVETPAHVERELPTDASGGRGSGAWPNEGEGNKTADREYRKGTEEFVRSGRVAEQAQKASEALDGAEGKTFRDAEEKARKGKPT